MADGSKIEWTDATWNPVTGCSVVSPGCTNCYAMRLAGTRLQHHPSRTGLTTMSKAGPVWNGQVRLNEEWLTQPLGWKKPRRIFVCAHGDLFHESVPDEWIDRVFAVMARAPQHTFQVLTKRSKRMREYFARRDRHNEIELAAEILIPGKHLLPNLPLPNVHLGVSTEDQQRADERIPDLLATPAAVRFISAEPLLGVIDLTNILVDGGRYNALRGEWMIDIGGPGGGENHTTRHGLPYLNQVIAGGESGRGARRMYPDLARVLRDQCAAAGVPFFFKQWGEWAPYDRSAYLSSKLSSARALDNPMQRFGKARAGRLLDGVEHNGMPEVAQ